MTRILRVATAAVLTLVLITACETGSSSSTPTAPNSPSAPNTPPENPPPKVNNPAPEEIFNSNSKDANAHSAIERIQKYHSPHGLVFSAMYNQEDTKDLFRWDGVADSAIWTGTYLAAASFRYRVTKTQSSLDEVLRILEAIRKISFIAPDGILARHVYPKNSSTLHAYVQDNPKLENILEANFEGVDYYYLTRTSRDQYGGVFFGLGVAYDMLNDANAKKTISAIVTRLTEYLLKHGWNTLNPDGSIRTSFLQMPGQQLSILQVAKHVNPERFTAEYEKLRKSSAGRVWLPFYIEGLDRESTYYKFNLNHIYAYNLIRLEDPNSPYMAEYLKAYEYLSSSVKGHMNGHFNMIDRAIRGPDLERDQQTIQLVDQLYDRGFKHSSVDVRGKYQECKTNKACDAVPMTERMRTGFIWQTPPWDMYFEEDGRIESPGIDYLLTYWMSRYYHVQ